MMRVAVDATPLTAQRMRGWTRYAVNLLAALPDQGVRPILLAREPLNPEHLTRLPVGSFDVEVAPAMSYPHWEQWWVPRACRRTRAVVYHCPRNFGVPAFCPIPRVLTLHDAIGQGRSAPPGPWRARLTRSDMATRVYHWVARTRSERVITVSEHARSELVGLLGLRPDRVTVVPEAADPIFHIPVGDRDRAAARARWNLPRPFLFYVGGWEERKNIPFLLRAFAEAGLADVDLVLAGGRDEQTAELDRLAAELRISSRTRLLGFVPDSDLPALYATALGFIYPSRAEGFGLQLVEAMATGCPILAARASCLPEILGAGGDTFTLDRSDEMVRQIRRLATDSTYRADLAGRASRRGAAFSWDRTAAETVAVYRSVARNPAR